MKRIGKTNLFLTWRGIGCAVSSPEKARRYNTYLLIGVSVAAVIVGNLLVGLVIYLNM